MDTRKTKKERLKKAAKYTSAATAATASAFDVIGLFVRIPGFIKWAAVALVGAIAACASCCTSDAANTVHEPNEALRETKRIDEGLHQDLAEIKRELKHHHELLVSAIESKDEKKIAEVQSQVVDRWQVIADNHEHKGEHRVSVSHVGLFKPAAIPLPTVPLDILLENKATMKMAA